MTTVIYRCNRQEIRITTNNPHFLLTNRVGDYLALGDQNHSNYDGYFVKIGNDHYKIAYNIYHEGLMKDIVIDENSVTRNYENAHQKFEILKEGVLVKLKGEFILTLDCKKLYDESDKGRIYKVERNHNAIRVLYTKYENESLSHHLYDLSIEISTSMENDILNRWREVQYTYDDRRGTGSTRWVYDVLRLHGEGEVFITTKKLSTKTPVSTHAPTLALLPYMAWHSLEALQTPTGVMAGLPWFFQEWSRDELISLGGLLAAKEYDKTIQILNKWYSAIQPDGTLPAIYPGQGLPSSDAPGWLGKRTRDLLVKMSDENILHKLPKETISYWKEQTGVLLDNCNKRIHDDLIWNDANTTWMDTASNDEGRAGARIEIQALYLALYDAHAHLCTLTKNTVDHNRSEKARKLSAAVHQRLVNNGVLLDGLHSDGRQDLTVRPNIFLACYIAPKLFTNEEWKQFFHRALPLLWLPWGGLSSIATNDKNYHAQYTGENVASYHRGDSWYFINNIAAIAMHAVDSQTFKQPVEAILKASTRDMLEQGYLGHCSELSSAQTQQAAGCHAQAWSASTLLEALQKIT